MPTSHAVEHETDEHDEDAVTPAEEALAAVHVGLWVSATRCILTYVVAPALGTLGVFLGPIGLVLQVLGAVTASTGAWNLWGLKHRARIPYVLVAAAVDLLAAFALFEILKDLI
ncbi:MAG: hypothetical protein JWQ74_710 [Marmoricola sp.]|nr:hypothetical protein [Marmoricola sp.]